MIPLGERTVPISLVCVRLSKSLGLSSVDITKNTARISNLIFNEYETLSEIITAPDLYFRLAEDANALPNHLVASALSTTERETRPSSNTRLLND